MPAAASAFSRALPPRLHQMNRSNTSPSRPKRTEASSTTSAAEQQQRNTHHKATELKDTQPHGRAKTPPAGAGNPSLQTQHIAHGEGKKVVAKKNEKVN